MSAVSWPQKGAAGSQGHGALSHHLPKGRLGGLWGCFEEEEQGVGRGGFGKKEAGFSLKVPETQISQISKSILPQRILLKNASPLWRTWGVEGGFLLAHSCLARTENNMWHTVGSINNCQ